MRCSYKTIDTKKKTYISKRKKKNLQCGSALQPEAEREIGQRTAAVPGLCTQRQLRLLTLLLLHVTRGVKKERSSAFGRPFASGFLVFVLKKKIPAISPLPLHFQKPCCFLGPCCRHRPTHTCTGTYNHRGMAGDRSTFVRLLGRA